MITKYFTGSVRRFNLPAAVVAAVLFGFGLQGCKTEENPMIELLAPANDATIDLTSSGNITFSWKKTESVTACTLKFASSEEALAKSGAVKEAGDKVSYVLAAVDADAMMARFTEVKPGASGAIYWTVVGGEAATQVRKMNIKRMPSRLKIDPAEVEFPAAPPTKGQTVTVQSNIAWTVTVDPADWLTATPASGTADGSFTLTAAPNTEGTERTATVTVSGEGVTAKTIAVTQAAGIVKELTLDNTGAEFLHDSFLHWVRVTSNTEWTATVPAEAASWITVNHLNTEREPISAPVTGNGIINIVATANDGATRTAVITVSGEGVASKTITVRQAENPPPYVSASAGRAIPANGNDLTTSLNIDANVAWSIEIPASEGWLTAERTSGEAGKDKVLLTATENAGEAERTAAITVRGNGAPPKTITVKQYGVGMFLEVSTAGIKFEQNPTAAVTVNVTSNTSWTVSKQGGWISVTPLAGNRDGSFTVTAEANNTGAARSATVTVSGQGVDRTEYIQIAQGATGAGTGVALPGTWYLQKVIAVTEEVPVDLTESKFTLNAAGTYTGEIMAIYGGKKTGNTPMTWEYSGGLFTFTDAEGITRIYIVTETTGQRLVMETGVAGSDGYVKMIYAKTPVTIRPSRR